MKLSNRVLGLTTSPIRKLTPYANAAVKAGKKIYHLNIGQPDIPTSPKFLEAIRSFDTKVISYGPSQGNPELLKAIAKYYQDWGMDYTEKDIYVTNGGSEALQFAAMSLCDPGDEILVFEPYYANYSTFAKLANAVIRAVPTQAENGYRLPAKEVVEQYITPKTRAILLTNPGNPTGVVYTKDEMKMIASLVLEHDIALIADERYSACGARIGCVVTKNAELCQQFNKLCQGRLCAPELEQVGAAAIYEHTPKSYLEEVNKEYKHRRDTIAAGLAAIPGLISAQPKGAFYVMVKLPVDDAEKFAIWMLQDFEDNGETVMIAPGNGFYATPGKGVDEARLAYVLNCDDLKRAMDLLAKGLKAYPGYTLK